MSMCPYEESYLDFEANYLALTYIPKRETDYRLHCSSFAMARIKSMALSYISAIPNISIHHSHQKYLR